MGDSEKQNDSAAKTASRIAAERLLDLAEDSFSVARIPELMPDAIRQNDD